MAHATAEKIEDLVALGMTVAGILIGIYAYCSYYLV